MNRKYKILFFVLLGIAALILAVLFLFSKEMVVLNPKGIIAYRERELLVLSTLLMLIVVIPVLIMTFGFIWKYRANNPKAKYDPSWNHSTFAEIVWWGFPTLIILVLSVVAWESTHELDPWKPLESENKPITIQVVALNWKWLFIYPEQNIAALNFVQFPENTPVRFKITADAPMNSFWIPQLGGQIYAMPGMTTELHLIADAEGEFKGSSANFSGEGFAGMKFIAKASSESAFNEWVDTVKQSGQELGSTSYEKLIEPSSNNPVELFTLSENDLFDQIVMKYMMPPK